MNVSQAAYPYSINFVEAVKPSDQEESAVNQPTTK